MQQASEGLGLTDKERARRILSSAESRDLMPLYITAILSARLLKSGPKADVTLLNFDVRFTSESGHSPTRLECLLWANRRPAKSQFLIVAKKERPPHGGLSEIRSGVLTRRLRRPLYFFQLFSCAPITAVRSGTEPGNLVIGGNAALRRQLVNKSWQNFRQLRSHVLFGHAGLFGQGLDK